MRKATLTHVLHGMVYCQRNDSCVVPVAGINDPDLSSGSKVCAPKSGWLTVALNSGLEAERIKTVNIMTVSRAVRVYCEHGQARAVRGQRDRSLSETKVRPRDTARLKALEHASTNSSLYPTYTPSTY